MYMYKQYVLKNDQQYQKKMCGLLGKNLPLQWLAFWLHIIFKSTLISIQDLWYVKNFSQGEHDLKRCECGKSSMNISRTSYTCACIV